jgi:hypothetical protein
VITIHAVCSSTFGEQQNWMNFDASAQDQQTLGMESRFYINS